MQPDTTLDHLITVTAAARIADCASETIRHWANTGRLPVAARVGQGMRLFDPDVVRRVAAGRRRQNGEAA